MQCLYPFNVRVYGILMNERQEILLSDEQEHGVRFTKFPGGGLEYGEGLIDGLKREYQEECGAEIAVLRHLYTTDFFEQSYFNDSQIISIYYLVKSLEDLKLNFKARAFDFEGEGEVLQSFRWLRLSDTLGQELTFKTDRRALEELSLQVKLKGWQD